MSDTHTGYLLHGQNYDPRTGFKVQFTQQEVNFAQGGIADAYGDAATDITPTDANASLVRVYIVDEASVLAYKKSYISTQGINFPDVLVSLTAVFAKNSGNGSFNETGGYVSSGTSANINVSGSGRGQGSGAIIPDLQIARKQTWGQNRPVTHYFYYTNTSITSATIIAKLASLFSVTVAAWPDWRPEAHTISLFGQQLSVAYDVKAHAESNQSTANTSYGQQSGLGINREVGVSTKTENLPPMIHGALSVVDATTGNTQTFTVVADARAQTSTPAQDSHPVLGPTTFSVTGTVSPSSLAATVGDSVIPTSGERILDVQVQIDAYYGFDLVHVTTFNFANLA